MQIRPDSLRMTLLDGGHFRMSEDGYVHRKTVPHIIVAQAVEGHYSIVCGDGRSTVLEEGEAFLTPPDLPLTITHHCNPRTGHMEVRWVHFNFIVFNSLNLAGFFELPLRMESGWAGKFGRISPEIVGLKKAGETLSLAQSVRLCEIGFNILRLLFDFLESKGIAPEFGQGTNRMLPALDFARRNLASSIDVPEMARRAGLSVPRFHAEFRRLFGCPPMEYVRRMRLSQACDMLMGGNSTLKEIAVLTGFSSQFHLSREFKKQYGRPPHEYRKTSGYYFSAPE